MKEVAQVTLKFITKTEVLLFLLAISSLLFKIFLAMAVYTRSPAAYDALKGFGILQLPSKATLQAYTGAIMHEPGARSECIESQVAHYVLFKVQCRVAGRQEPRLDAMLLLDEVKVACQLMWNSRSHQLQWALQ